MKIIRLFVKLIVLLIIIAILNIAWALTSGGKRYIENYITHAINKNSNYEIYINRISFALPLKLKVKYINLKDNSGEFLRINDAIISLRPNLELFKKHIIFNEITAQKIELIRSPDALEKNPESSAASDLGYIIEVNKFNIDKLTLFNSYELRINSSLNLNGPSKLIDFAGSVNDKENNLNVKGTYSIDKNLLNFSDLSIKSKYIEAQGNLDLDLNNYHANGNISVNSYYINTGINFNYKDDKLSLEAEDLLSLNMDILKTGGNISFNNIKIKDIHKDLLDGNLEINLNEKKVVGRLKLEATHLNKMHPDIKGSYKGMLILKSLQDKQFIELNLIATNLPFEKFKTINLKLGGHFNNINNEYESLIDKLNITSGKYFIKNTKPFKITKTNNITKFDLSRININHVNANLSGTLDHDQIDSNLDFSSNNLQDFLSLFLPQEHCLSAAVKGKINIYGNIKDPKVNGNINLSRGNYKNLELGTTVKNITIKLDIKDDLIFTKHCAFSDLKGKIASCIFSMQLNSLNKDFSVSINADNYYLFLPQIGMQGSVNTKLKLEGDKSGVNLSGKVYVNSAEIKIPEHFGPTIYELNIIEKKDNLKLSRDKLFPFLMNIELSAKNKIFVRGYGLDIELSGDLKVSNPKNRLSIDGKLTTLRGRYQEFGKYFNIAKGELKFEGAVPPSPILHVIGTTTVDTNQINLELAGPLLSPLLSIYSNPPLSQEEALSLILFGKKSDNITAFQAISLANSLKRLSGRGDNGLQVLGAARKLLHVDNISLSQDDATGNTKVEVGKYISDKVYFKIEKSIESGSATTGIEYELKPNINLEGSAGGEGDSNVGINWKKDF